MDKSVGGQSPEISRRALKVSTTIKEHSTAYDMNEKLCRDMRTTKKLTNTRKLLGLKLRGATYAISKIRGKFQNRILREYNIGLIGRLNSGIFRIFDPRE